MKALVVYDSLYGNTKAIADAIGTAIGAAIGDPGGEVDLLHASQTDASGLANCDLLIVGAPTHGGRPSESVKELLNGMQPRALEGIRVAGFDTRHTHWLTRLFGYAAPRIVKALRQAGGTPAGKPGDFYVTGTEGPLVEGELERAAAWAKKLAVIEQ